MTANMPCTFIRGSALGVAGPSSFDSWVFRAFEPARCIADALPCVNAESPASAASEAIDGALREIGSCAPGASFDMHRTRFQAQPRKSGFTGGRRGGRVVECTALEMRHACKGIGGSNPSLSAIKVLISLAF